MRRRETRKEKRKRRAAKTEKSWTDIVTWNVQRMSLGTHNKRKLRSVAEYTNKEDWDVVLLSEVRASGSGTIWLGENANLTAITYMEKTAILLQGETPKVMV